MSEAPAAYTWVVLILLTMLSGMFSGLNLGLMSLTVDDLNIVIKSSADKAEVVNAERILRLRRHGNLLLCTLLIGNTLVNVMLAVVTDPIWVYLFGTGTAGTILALVLPSLLIVVFGEIVPQSICSRYALLIGAKTLPITYFFVFVTFLMAYPISKILDRLLGDEIGAVYTRRGFVQLVRLNAESPEHVLQSGLNEQDGKILVGALTLPERNIGQVMTSLHRVFSLPRDAKLDKKLFLTIIQRGHTRIPVHDSDPSNIAGILHTNCLLGIGFERDLTIHGVMQKLHQNSSNAVKVRCVPKATPCNVALEVCKREGVQILVVTEGGASNTGSDLPQGIGPAIGIATVEDFIEEILQDEIVDEMDEFTDNGASSTGVSRGESLAHISRSRSRAAAGLARQRSMSKCLNSKRVDAAVVLRGLVKMSSGSVEAQHLQPPGCVPE